MTIKTIVQDVLITYHSVLPLESRNLIEFRHIVGEDLATCCHCKFPTNHSYMKKMLNTDGLERTCPMCNANVTIDDYTFLGEKGVSSLKRAAPPKEEKKA